MIEIKPDPYFCGLVNKGVCREKKSFITLSSSRVLIYSHLYCITRVKKLFFSGRGTNLIWTSGPLIPQSKSVYSSLFPDLKFSVSRGQTGSEQSWSEPSQNFMAFFDNILRSVIL